MPTPESDAFPHLLVTRMDVAKEVDIETKSPDGKVHRVTIWIVVVEGAPYVRSVRGTRGRWYREITARKEGALHVGSRKVPVRPTKVRAPELIDEVSAALWRKYPKSSSLFSMLRYVTLDTTLRLDPA
ncbi:MAG: hypothetical protein AUH85_12650 [Chloroflexi bacterium 13_1_40CM_4_68_4]|nr:MAG: hypothetical protein AUH85_12650 [Chloroflexi bacterium 13_1_40CM_4_68_4]